MLLNLLFDVILILILVLGSYFGYTRGFFRMVARPMRLVLCLCLSIAFCRPIGESIIAPLIEAPIRNFIEELMYEKLIGLSPDALATEIPTVMWIAAVIFDLPADIAADTVDGTVEQVISSLVPPVVNMISVGLAFLILLLLLRIAFNLLIDLADEILSLGVIGSMNRFFGVVLSCSFAFAVSWLFTQGADLLLRTPMLLDSDITRNFEGGPIYRFFISFSPLRLLLSF